MLRRYVRGPGMDEPIVWYEGAGTGDRRFLHADERGSIIAVSDAAGNPIAINKYDEYGVSAPGNLGRFQYTGQAWMPEIGLYHYKARAYAPYLGRFMQTDPIGYGDGMNLYGYVAGDPANNADSFGLSANEILTGTRLRRIDGMQPNGLCGSCSGNPGVGDPYSKGASSGSTGSAGIWEITETNFADGSTRTWREERIDGAFFTLASGPSTGWAKNPIEVARAIAEEELERSANLAPGADHHTRYDAERHARWVYRMAQQLGPLWADIISQAHELHGLSRGAPLREYYMDIHNNNIGLKAFVRGQPIPNINSEGLIWIK